MRVYLQKDSKKKVSILFGSQTGTAERFAKELKDSLIDRYGKDREYEVMDFDDYEHEERLPQEELVFMTLATYGEGEPTTNALTFHNWINSISEASSAQNRPLAASFICRRLSPL